MYTILWICGAHHCDTVPFITLNLFFKMPITHSTLILLDDMVWHLDLTSYGKGWVFEARFWPDSIGSTPALRKSDVMENAAQS